MTSDQQTATDDRHDEREWASVIGYRFPGGTVTIEPYEHWLMCDAVGAEPRREGTANPMYVYYGASTCTSR